MLNARSSYGTSLLAVSSGKPGGVNWVSKYRR